MKLLTQITTLTVTSLPLAAAVLSCNRIGGEFGDTVARYEIVGDPNPFPDTPGICGGLWDNMKRFGVCAAPSMTDCRDEFGRFSWDFDVSVGCNNGMIESTWWEATKNEGGALTCH